MKIGSIVECIDNTGFEQYVKKQTPYTVREILPLKSIIDGKLPTTKIIVGEVCIRLEEVNPTWYGFNNEFPDMPFPMKNFRELEFNSNELEEIFNRELELV